MVDSGIVYLVQNLNDHLNRTTNILSSSTPSEERQHEMRSRSSLLLLTETSPAASQRVLAAPLDSCDCRTRLAAGLGLFEVERKIPTIKSTWWFQNAFSSFFRNVWIFLATGVLKHVSFALRGACSVCLTSWVASLIFCTAKLVRISIRGALAAGGEDVFP